MSDYSTVSRALRDGAEPRMLCMTCPWTRNCIEPPTMTRAEIDTEIDRASQEDKALEDQARAAGQKIMPNLPYSTLITAAVMAGKDTAAQVCPVFAARLGTPSGRDVAGKIRDAMQDWPEAA